MSHTMRCDGCQQFMLDDKLTEVGQHSNRRYYCDKCLERIKKEEEKIKNEDNQKDSD